MTKYWSHNTAEVSEASKIGKETKIWHNSQVMSGAVVGDNCTIGHNCLISGKAKLGNGVKIESNVDVWDLVELEDYVFVGPGAVFTNDPTPRAKYPKSKFPELGKWEPTLVYEGATIGANSTIVCGVTIGRHAMVGAGAVVTKDVPDYTLVVGTPAKSIGWVCECGNRLEFIEQETECATCQRKYTKTDEIVKEIN